MFLLGQLRGAVLAVPLALRCDLEVRARGMGDLRAALAAEHVASIVAHVAVLVPLFGVLVFVLLSFVFDSCR